ncbi:FAD-binding oxidoreductase [Nocardia sp. CDC153]|uniref:NAD(P)/FAD-dependent oxidoreductase n=1 Tax=Nocardia sp. CDC153 TaxID=3112167 RepID=UPI002DBE05CA|nr:FAD-binding oxidoreductase [Nocardia sp. CDC153]MEC3956862.1 FAD-binding oxidoreductase [Nocardia sp. CDC153]
MVDATRCLDTAPIWVQLSDYVPTGPALRGSTRADLVIVGGGLAGLATAYYAALARPDLKITVLEAGRIGAGATGASTGIVGPGLKMAIPVLRKKYGDTLARAAFDASQHGVELLAELIRAAAIECDARPEPHTLAALTPRQRDRMAVHLSHLEQLGRGIGWLDPEELTERAGPGFLAGFSYDNVLLVDPYRLLVGLADTVRELGVQVHEYSRVLELIPARGQTTRLTTTAADITADRVLLAVDGYARDLNPFPHSVVPIRAHVLATAPLTDDQMAGLGWNGRGGIIDQRNYFNYYRMTADRRLVFGGGPVIVPTGDPVHDARSADAVHQRLLREMTARFPVLHDIPVVARWTARAASTQDRLPVVSPVPGKPGVYHAGAWCGHGLSLAVDSAWRFGGFLSGRTDSELPWTQPRGFALPKRALEAGTRAYLRALDIADRQDMRDAVPVTPAAAPAPRTSSKEVVHS